MNAAKIRLSSEEAALIERSDWILTKNSIIVKVQKLFECLQIRQQQWVSPLFDQHPSIAKYYPKISKGENYRGLPYLVLDHPRCFEKNGAIAIRTMFWWGHFFSTTLLLSGVFKDEYGPKIIASFDLLAIEKYSIGVNTDPWLHHFGPDNYKEVALITKDLFEDECNKAGHLKIAKTISLKDGYPQQKLFENWTELATVCFA